MLRLELAETGLIDRVSSKGRDRFSDESLVFFSANIVVAFPLLFPLRAAKRLEF